MSILTLRNIQLTYGPQPLLDDVNLTIRPGERICLIGRNGCGKSTLMKIIAGELTPDKGVIETSQTLKVTRLIQEVPAVVAGTVFDVCASGLGEAVKLIAAYQQLTAEYSLKHEDSVLKKMEKLQHRIEASDGWRVQSRVETVLSKLSLNPDAVFSSLSGGLKRRVLLAKALVLEPDILLLDEPTNHLDIEAITWLEEFLVNYGKTLLFVTHDRKFLTAVATRIIEIDRGKLTSWDCNYQTYLERKEAALEAEARSDALFDKNLAKEEVWIRQGIKARRTRNEGRVRELKKLREERSERRKLVGKASMESLRAEKSGKIVIEAEHLSHSYEQHPILKDFSTIIQRGDKIGIIGPNGCGKTTLLNILLGELKPSLGTVKLGTNLKIAYFDQMRAQLDEKLSVLDNLAEGSTMVTINGQSKHVISYLQDFLFSPERARSPVTALSGGERNRLLLAKLFTKEANLLVMDEPTNDLDIETLDFLEDLLVEYNGTLLLVSHDRAFLNNVVTSTIAYEGEGTFSEYVGGYDDWQRQRKAATAASSKNEKKAKSKPPAASKLSFSERDELKKLPKIIEKLEKEQQALQDQMADSEFYQQDKAAITAAAERLETVNQELGHAYERWGDLESR